MIYIHGTAVCGFGYVVADAVGDIYTAHHYVKTGGEAFCNDHEGG